MSQEPRTFRLTVRDLGEFLGVSDGSKNAWRPWVRGIGRRFVYVLRSDTDPARHYVGVTGDVDERLDRRRYWVLAKRAGAGCGARTSDCGAAIAAIDERKPGEAPGRAPSLATTGSRQGR
jgi:hypothetical protein